jgi:broad specificity phosphatase PhoE
MIANNGFRVPIDDKYDTVLLLIRHGQSVGNLNYEFLGHMNKDLSELGYAQAARTAEFLSGEQIDMVYSSDLMRAHNTALPHAKIRGLDVVDSSGLREIYAGEWEGLRIEYIKEKYGNYYTDVWRAQFGTCRIPGGESVPELAERIHTELLRISKENKGKRILVGLHAAAIRAFFGKIRGVAPHELASAFDFPTNASVSVVYFDGEKLIPGCYSYDEHLKNIDG